MRTDRSPVLTSSAVAHQRAGRQPPTTPLSPLSRVLSDFTRDLTGRLTVDAVLTRLNRAAGELLPVDGYGVMSIVAGQTCYVASSSAPAEVAERAQSGTGGPCQSSYRKASRIVVRDLTRTGSWTGYSTATVGAGFRAVVAIPLVGRDRVLGVLDLYAHDPGLFDPDVLAAAQTLADVATTHALMASDQQDAAQALAAMSHRALHDPLTGLANRALFTDRLDRALAARRRHQVPVVVIALDLDGFKAVNDTFGHAAGDRVLREVGSRFAAVVRAEETLARLGGDEFAVVSTPATDGGGGTPAALAGAARTTERLAASLAAPIEVGDQQVYVNASIGLAAAGPGQQSTESLIHAADRAMYRLKQLAPGIVEITHDRSDRAAESRTRLVGELRRATARCADAEQDPFRLVYRPVVELHPGRGQRPRRQVAASLRWEHPTRGLLHPAHFLEAAEETGLIVDIGQSVLRQACRLAARWQDAGYDSTVAVTVGDVELHSPGFVDRLRSSTGWAGIDPSWLRLEIGGRAHPGAAEEVGPILAGVRGLGVGLTLAGFGRATWSIAQVQLLPIDTIKVDGSFTARLGEAAGTAVFGGILSMARALDCRTVAARVQTREQFGQLEWLGCDQGQGPFFGAPVPPAEMIAAGRSGPPTAHSSRPAR